MANTKPIGVAYEDQYLNGAVIENSTITIPGTTLNAVVIGSTGGTAGFFGTTPVSQQAAITAVTNTATGTELATAINALRTTLINLGLTA